MAATYVLAIQAHHIAIRKHRRIKRSWILSFKYPRTVDRRLIKGYEAPLIAESIQRKLVRECSKRAVDRHCSPVIATYLVGSRNRSACSGTHKVADILLSRRQR